MGEKVDVGFVYLVATMPWACIGGNTSSQSQDNCRATLLHFTAAGTLADLKLRDVTIAPPPRALNASGTKLIAAEPGKSGDTLMKDSNALMKGVAAGALPALWLLVVSHGALLYTTLNRHVKKGTLTQMA